MDDDAADDRAGLRQRYSARDAARAAAQQADELARAPVVPPTGSFETCSLIVNLCAGPQGAAARVEAVESGAMLDLTKLLLILSRNGGAPAPDAAGRDIVKPVAALLRSLSLEANPMVMPEAVEAVARLVEAGCTPRLAEAALTAVIWAMSNLARTGPRLQNQLREAGALPALIRVTARINGEGQGGGQAEVAAVLAALTNLANGNPVNQGRLRQEAGLMEAGRRGTRDPGPGTRDPLSAGVCTAATYSS